MRVVHVFVAVTLGLGLAAAPTAAQQQRHGNWQDEAERVQELIDELRPLIERSRRARAADPRFLEDMEAILGRYDSPWPVPLLADDFGDGDFTRNPAWTVHSGEFSIHPRRGLLSRVDPTLASRRYSRDAPGYQPAGAVGTPIPRGAGTAIGDATGGGGLAASFDGVTNQSHRSSSRKRAGDMYILYVGKDWGFGNKKIIRQVKIYASNSEGYQKPNSQVINLDVYGSDRAPSNSTDGILLLRGSTNDDNNDTVTVSGLPTNRAYQYHWVRLHMTDNDNGDDSQIAEVEFYQSGPARATGRAPVREPAAHDIATPAQAISSGDLRRGGDRRFAFDDDLRTSWTSYFDGPGNEYRAFIGQDFGTARHIRSITLTQRQDSANGNASRVDVQRWANGRWETVASFSIAPDQNRQLLRLPPSAAAARWRLLATSTNVIARGAYWSVAEVEFMQEPSPVIAGPAADDGGQPPRSNLEDIGAQILKQILQGRRPATQFHGGATPPPTARQPADTQVAQGQYQPYRQLRADAAEISTRLEIPNAFSIRLRLTSLGKQGRLLFGPYQGGNRRAGYRLAYNPGGRPSLELLRVGSRGRRPRVIESYDDPVALRDGRPHLLEWTRTADGTMTVSVDSRELMRVQDRRFRDPFDGFTLINRGGDYALRWIRIKGTR